MSLFLDMLEGKIELDSSKWHDGRIFGHSHRAQRCKCCNLSGQVRDFTEFYLRNNVRYDDIIDFVFEATAGKVRLNRANLSSHANRHLCQEDLVAPVFLPEGRLGPLLPRSFVNQIPYDVIDGKIHVSKCVLPYCGCEWRKPGDACTFKGDCPAREYELSPDHNHNYIVDCRCEVCTSPFRLFIDLLNPTN